MRDHARESYLASGPLARFDVRRIDARGGQLDPHFTRTGTRRLNFTDPQDVARGAVALIVGSLHGSNSLVRHDNMTARSENRPRTGTPAARYQAGINWAAGVKREVQSSTNVSTSVRKDPKTYPGSKNRNYCSKSLRPLMMRCHGRVIWKGPGAFHF